MIGDLLAPYRPGLGFIEPALVLFSDRAGLWSTADGLYQLGIFSCLSVVPPGAYAIAAGQALLEPA